MKIKRSIVLSLTLSTILMGTVTQIQAASDEVTVYSSRKEHLIKPLFEQFTKKNRHRSKLSNWKWG
jgi:iron(III) transport system substrate-binding protein